MGIPRAKTIEYIYGPFNGFEVIHLPAPIYRICVSFALNYAIVKRYMGLLTSFVS